MPAIVGNFKVVNVGPSSIIQIGDAVQLAPSSVSKTFAARGPLIQGILPIPIMR